MILPITITRNNLSFVIFFLEIHLEKDTFLTFVAMKDHDREGMGL